MSDQKVSKVYVHEFLPDQIDYIIEKDGRIRFELGSEWLTIEVHARRGGGIEITSIGGQQLQVLPVVSNVIVVKCAEDRP